MKLCSWAGGILQKEMAHLGERQVQAEGKLAGGRPCPFGHVAVTRAGGDAESGGRVGRTCKVETGW